MAETENWIPRTDLGKKVMDGTIKSIDEIFELGIKIKEPEIVEKLLPELKNELVFIGGSPGKGGGIRRTPTQRTARMHRSGRRFKVSAVMVVGDSNGHLGIGRAEAKENRGAIKKALKVAKLNIIPIKRGCGSWECKCDKLHSIPIETKGKKGSVEVVLRPAPQGIGICTSNALKKMVSLAGIEDIWSKSFSNRQNRKNAVFALFNAFKNMNTTKVK